MGKVDLHYVCRLYVFRAFHSRYVLWTLFDDCAVYRLLGELDKNFVPVYTKKFMGRAIMIGAFGWVAYTAVTLTLVLMLHVTGIDPLPADAPILQQNAPTQELSSTK